MFVVIHGTCCFADDTYIVFRVVGCVVYAVVAGARYIIVDAVNIVVVGTAVDLCCCCTCLRYSLFVLLSLYMLLLSVLLVLLSLLLLYFETALDCLSFVRVVC